MQQSIEKQGERAGLIVLVLFWLFALAALSQAARGQELQPVTRPQAAPQGTANRQPAQAQKPTQTQKKDTTQPASPDQDASASRFILVSIPDRQIALVDNGEVVKVYPIAVGKTSTPSPEGEFSVVSRTVNPTYYHEGKIIPPGKDNPVGTRWIGLSLKGYGIHGTNAPKSIGKAASHGCIRMAKKDLEEFFTLVRVGDVVTIRGERDELVAQVLGDGSTDVQVASAALPSGDAGNE